MTDREIMAVHEGAAGRIMVADSVTFSDDRLRLTDVLVAGSFAGASAFGLALVFGIRAIIAHEAGPGLDRAGISGLPAADRLGVAAAAVGTMTARIGDGRSVLEDGVIAHANQRARALGVRPGMAGREAARLLLAAAPGRLGTGAELIDRTRRTVLATDRGRVVLVASTGLAEAANGRDVLCAGSHGGRVNTPRLLSVRPRGALTSDAGLARDRSGVAGLSILEDAGIAAATVDAETARIGDPASLWETGVVSSANPTAERAGVRVGQPARDAARLMLEAI